MCRPGCAGPGVPAQVCPFGWVVWSGVRGGPAAGARRWRGQGHGRGRPVGGLLVTWSSTGVHGRGRSRLGATCVGLDRARHGCWSGHRRWRSQVGTSRERAARRRACGSAEGGDPAGVVPTACACSSAAGRVLGAGPCACLPGLRTVGLRLPSPPPPPLVGLDVPVRWRVEVRSATDVGGSPQAPPSQAWACGRDGRVPGRSAARVQGGRVALRCGVQHR